MVPDDDPCVDEPARGEGARGAILIVDDEDILRKTMRCILEIEGYDVELAGDGAGALAVCSIRHFDLVITDIAMPGMDGVQLADKLSVDCPATSVLFISGHATRSRLPADARFLAKPFTAEELVNAVVNAFAARPSN